MKKNLILTGIVKKVKKDSFYLSSGSYDYKKGSLSNNRILFKDVFIKNLFLKEYTYLQKINEKLLIFLKDHLNKKFSLNNDQNYWRIILYHWLTRYTSHNYNKWKLINKLKKKSSTKYCVENFSSDLDTKINKDFIHYASKLNCDYYNFFITKRIINYCKLKNIIFLNNNNIKKKNKLKNPEFNFSLKFFCLKYIDLIISKIAFKYNDIFFDTFYYPSKYFINLCFSLNLIPVKNTGLFTNKNKVNLRLYSSKERMNSLSKLNKKNSYDIFYEYLKNNILIDLPMSYFENYEELKAQIIKKAQRKKTIISMHSLFNNDLFKIYTAETKKIGSRVILVDHGGQIHKYRAVYNYTNIISDEVVKWSKGGKSKKEITNLSPTKFKPDFKIQNTSDKCCTIVSTENNKFNFMTHSIIGLEDDIKEFKDLIIFAKSLNSNIKKKLRFRTKHIQTIGKMDKFSKIFGKVAADIYSPKNNFVNCMSKSKLLIFTYPQTAFLDSMYYNKPSILLWSSLWIYQDAFYKHIRIFKKQNMAFENMKTASAFINSNWNTIDDWWGSKKVQTARKDFLKDFFNVDKNWHQNWIIYLKKQKMKLESNARIYKKL